MAESRRNNLRKTLILIPALTVEHSLVMIDNETQSYWSQLLGQAMRGQLTGSVLKTIPSVMTNWKSCRPRYPESTAAVMS